MNSKIDAMTNRLDKLFLEIYDGLSNDMEEAEENIAAYKEIISDSEDMRGVYGTLLNDSMRLKGQVRDKQLKFVNSYKERIAKLESDELKLQMNKNATDEDDFDINHSEVSQILRQMAKNKEIEKRVYDVSDESISNEDD